MTTQEKKSFNRAKHDFLKQGYPLDVAEQRAWDIYFASRRGLDRKALEVFA